MRGAVARTTRRFDVEHPPQARGELNVSWELPLATKQLVAVRMIRRVTSSGVTETKRQVFYTGRTSATVWAGMDLVQPDQLDRFNELANSKLEVANSLTEVDKPPGWLLSDPRFEPDGSLTLRLSWPQGSVGEGLEVKLTAKEVKPLLSDRGRMVAGESRIPRTTGARAQADWSRRSRSVDCDVQKCVALTFDDGPGEHTEKLLDDLEEAGVPATFFVLGQSAQAYPKLIKRMVADGHQVANHTYHHQEMTKLSPAAQSREVARGRDEIQKAGAPKTKLLRPPYGAYDKTTQKLGAPLILSDVDTLDWQNRSKKVTTGRALRLVRPGSIILAHDIHDSTVKAAPGIVDKLQAEG